MASSSRSSQQNTQHSSTQVSNLNLQDVEGITLLNSAGAQITTTDHGAIAGALDVGIEALRLGGDVVSDGMSLAGRGFDAAEDMTRATLDSNIAVTREALRFSEGAVGDALGFGRDALDLTGATTRDALQRITEFGDLALEGSLAFARDLTDANLTGLTALAQQTSASADDRVTKTAMYAFAAVAAIMVLPAIFKS